MAKLKQKVVPVGQLVSCLKIPRPFSRKILQQLNKKRILHSSKGKGGGFSLSRRPDKLSLYDLITAFQGPLRLNDHSFKKRVCPHIKNCKVKKKLDSVEKIMIGQLKSITIADIIKH